MSTQAASNFNWGFHRRLLAAVRLTPPGGNVPCPICCGPTHGGEMSTTNETAVALYCRNRNCFAVTQEIDRQFAIPPGNG